MKICMESKKKNKRWEEDLTTTTILYRKAQTQQNGEAIYILYINVYMICTICIDQTNMGDVYHTTKKAKIDVLDVRHECCIVISRCEGSVKCDFIPPAVTDEIWLTRDLSTSIG